MLLLLACTAPTDPSVRHSVAGHALEPAVPAYSADADAIASEWTYEDGWYVSPVLETDEPRTRVAAMVDRRWDADPELIPVMVRTVDGDTIGAWSDVEEAWSEDALRNVNLDVSATSGAQIRVRADALDRLADLSWSLFDPVGVEEPTTRVPTSSPPPSAFTAIGVISRADWGARDEVCSSPDPTKTQMAIHHTASETDNGGDIASKVRQLQAWAIDSAGYCDIPYEFLMGIDGSIYEGRAIGELSAATGGHNSGTVAMSAVGCFDSAGCASGGDTPSDAMILAYGSLVATTASVYGIPIDADHVKGHRDYGNETACPGDRLWARLGDVRSLAGGSSGASGGSSGSSGSSGDGYGWDDHDGDVVGIAATPAGDGYWIAWSDGRVEAFGAATDRGDVADLALAAPVRAIVATPTGRGYWLVAEDGGVFTLGDAGFFGSAAGAITAPVVAMAATDTGRGYWLAGSDGAVYAFGDATDAGDMYGRAMNADVVGIVSTTDGYCLIGGDGGAFCFGGEPYLGSMGGTALSAPVVGAAPDPDGRGYRMVGADGGVFDFDASYYGSMAGTALSRPVTGIAAVPGGYWMVGGDGGIFSFGAARYYGNGL
jgi:hypothetical protein